MLPGGDGVRDSSDFMFEVLGGAIRLTDKEPKDLIWELIIVPIEGSRRVCARGEGAAP